MRIIAGEFRGRKLLPPEGDATRPITDRVKQSLFDMLAPRIEGATVYDLFAGTGSMGLECLSRGAARAHFFEADRSAVGRLRQNIAALGVGGRSAVQGGDLFKYFASTRPPAGAPDLASDPVSSPPSAPPPSSPADLVFLDPPYRFLTERPADLLRLAADLRRLLAADGLVLFRHDAADRLELPPLRRYDERTYGGMTLEWLKADAEL